MIRRFLGTALTSQAALSPASGFKWKVLQFRLDLITGPTAGTRSVQVVFQDINGTFGGDSIFTGNVTTVSSEFTTGLVHGNQSNFNVAPAQQTSELILTEFDRIMFFLTLIAGDTFNFDLIVEESAA